MKLLDNSEIRTVLVPDADRFAGTVNSDAVSLAYWDHVTFIVQIGEVTTTGATKITLEKSTSKAMGSPVAVPFTYKTSTVTGAWGDWTAVAASTGVTTSGTSNQVIVIEVDAAELGSGYTHVWLDCVESSNYAVDACVTAILSRSRYPQDDMRIGLS